MIKKIRLPLFLILAFLASAIIGFSEVQAQSISKSTMITQLQTINQRVYVEEAGRFTQLTSSLIGGYDQMAEDYVAYLQSLGTKKIYVGDSSLYDALRKKVSSHSSATPDLEVVKAVKSIFYCFEVNFDPKISKKSKRKLMKKVKKSRVDVEEQKER